MGAAKLLLLAALAASPVSGWTPSANVPTAGRSSTRLFSSTRSSAPTRRPKRSVQDRSSEEALSLIRDVTQAAMQAGPRSAPLRTLQAYVALSRTLQDFVPGPGRTAETFSAPVALRKLFERLGATYIKLGQFVASSPSLFPKEYVVRASLERPGKFAFRLMTNLELLG